MFSNIRVILGPIFSQHHISLIRDIQDQFSFDLVYSPLDMLDHYLWADLTRLTEALAMNLYIPVPLSFFVLSIDTILPHLLYFLICLYHLGYYDDITNALFSIL